MTKQVLLLVTGKLEEHALHTSLAGLFAGVDATFERPERSSEFTSATLGPFPVSGSPEARATRAGKLAAALIAAIEPGRRRRPDLVVAIDDLELCNAHQPGHVVDYFRRAVLEHVGTFPWSSAKSQDDVRRRLRERCSFHLLAPMVEAYFYGEAAALARAGQIKPSLFDASTEDIEHFRVDDPAYEASQDPCWSTASRGLHPKLYLKFLCDPGEYRETHGGARALASLAWRAVLQKTLHGQLVRALVDDIADALGVPNPCPGELSAHTGRRPGAVLRNL